jgi:hypothetical protein
MKRENLELAKNVIMEIEKRETLLIDLEKMISDDGDIYINVELLGYGSISVPKIYQDSAQKYLKHILHAVNQELNDLNKKLEDL